MITIRRVLCPVDFSETSRHALVHATAVAEWYASELTLLNVVPAMPLPAIRLAGSADADNPVTPDRQSLLDELHVWLEPARSAGVTADARLDAGNPAVRIVEQAARMNADLLVMGTHGLSGFERFLLGSVTEKVVRTAACPVMTVPPASATSAKLPYKRLLCPVDFSDSSLAALELAFSMAKEADAEVTIVHVCEWPAGDERAIRRVDTPTFRELAEDEARSRLDALITEDLRTWCAPSAVVVHGVPYREILALADREAADLIVIGVRGRNPFTLAVFGSTANQVVRHASCPVVTVRR